MRALPDEVVHLPFVGAAPYRMSMDLRTVPEAAWFEIDRLYVSEMAEKRRLMDAVYGEVFAALAESDAARAEALEVVLTALVSHHPYWFGRDGAVVRNGLTGERWTVGAIDPLDLAGRLVQEDLCLIQNGVFTAASLCFPSRWRLMEKIGKTLAAVHGPVPFYADRLARGVDRFMHYLKSGHIASRLNWSLLDNPALFQPSGKWRVAGGSVITVENAGQCVFLRVERQTLRRLPVSGAVLFGIRVHVYPLERVIRTAECAADLAAAVRALPAEVQHYKSLLPFRAALLGWLEGRRWAADGAAADLERG